MVDEKTKQTRQDEQPASLPVKTRGEKLRSRWAQIQCSHLLRRHRFRRKTQNHMNRFSAKVRATPLLLALGELFYALGFAAEYTAVRLGFPSGVTHRPMMLPPCRPMGASMTPGPRGSSPSTTA